MTYSITRQLEFDAGHRVYGHEGKCANIHGHRYVVFITAEPSIGLDDLGRVVDFSVIKEKVGGWIDECLDHGMILWREDPIADFWRGKPNGEYHKHVFMDENPTAENIAKMIYKACLNMFGGDKITVTDVTVKETPNCSATYKP